MTWFDSPSSANEVALAQTIAGKKSRVGRQAGLVSRIMHARRIADSVAARNLSSAKCPDFLRAVCRMHRADVHVSDRSHKGRTATPVGSERPSIQVASADESAADGDRATQSPDIGSCIGLCWHQVGTLSTTGRIRKTGPVPHKVLHGHESSPCSHLRAFALFLPVPRCELADPLDHSAYVFACKVGLSRSVRCIVAQPSPTCYQLAFRRGNNLVPSITCLRKRSLVSRNRAVSLHSQRVSPAEVLEERL